MGGRESGKEKGTGGSVEVGGLWLWVCVQGRPHRADPHGE